MATSKTELERIQALETNMSNFEKAHEEMKGDLKDLLKLLQAQKEENVKLHTWITVTLPQTQEALFKKTAARVKKSIRECRENPPEFLKIRKNSLKPSSEEVELKPKKDSFEEDESEKEVRKTWNKAMIAMIIAFTALVIGLMQHITGGFGNATDKRITEASRTQLPFEMPAVMPKGKENGIKN